MEEFDLDNPAPAPDTKHENDDLAQAPAAKTTNSGKKRLRLRGDLEVDDRKYKGKRIRRSEANVADVAERPILELGSEDDFEKQVGSETDSALDSMDDRDADVNVKKFVYESDDEKHQELEIKKRLMQEKEREMRRAIAVRKQKATIDSAIDLRIRLEQIVSAIRQLPGGDEREGISEFKELEEELLVVAQSLESLSDKFRLVSALVLPDLVDDISDKSAETWRDSVLDLWGRKVSEAEGLAPKGGFKVIDTSLSGQLRSRIGRGEHVAKSRQAPKSLNRSGDRAPVSELDFNDRTLFRSLLHEVIEGGDAEAEAMKQEQLAKTASVKRKYDWKVSKGKKLKNVVFDKLVGFLAPVPLPDPGPVDEILAALFGGCNGSIVT